MGRMRNTVAGRGLFGLAVIAALAFGSNQVMAAPARAQAAARVCSGPNWNCNTLCIRLGYEAGYCYGGYDCICY